MILFNKWKRIFPLNKPINEIHSQYSWEILPVSSTIGDKPFLIVYRPVHIVASLRTIDKQHSPLPHNKFLHSLYYVFRYRNKAIHELYSHSFNFEKNIRKLILFLYSASNTIGVIPAINWLNECGTRIWNNNSIEGAFVCLFVDVSPRGYWWTINIDALDRGNADT